MIHNPDNFTDWGQSDGWRLLDKDEICGTVNLPFLNEIEAWNQIEWGWRLRYMGNEIEITYRTKLTREELAAKRGINNHTKMSKKYPTCYDSLCHHNTEKRGIKPRIEPSESGNIIGLVGGDSERDWSEDFSHENGNYQNKCCDCGHFFIGYKRKVLCKSCATPQSVKDENALLKSQLKELSERMAEKDAENMELRKDKGRMDWLHHEGINKTHADENLEGTYFVDGYYHKYCNLRDAIDLAIAQSPSTHKAE